MKDLGYRLICKNSHMRIFLYLLILSYYFISCTKIVSTNPYDPDCPKQLFTPSSLIAKLDAEGVQLNWSIVDKNITGYRLKKSVNGSPQSNLTTLPKDSSQFFDSSIELGKVYRYELIAYAGNNESNSIFVEITSKIKVVTSAPYAIFYTEATLGGIINATIGSSIRAQGISWKALNTDNSISSTMPGSTGAFSMTISNLSPNTTYSYKAYALDDQNNRIYGKENIFTTRMLGLANINTLSPSSITSSLATVGNQIIDNGGSTITENGILYSISQNPTINDNKVINTTGNNNFTTSLIGLLPATTYYVRAYAINNLGTSYGNQISFTTTIRTINTGSVSDFEGNTYRTVSIGNQVWMAENLKSTKYNNGLSIANITDSIAWGTFTNGAYCWYNNSISYKQTYGALYNYYAINTENLCPIGWHIPSDVEWDILISFLGGSSVAGGKMKEAGNTHWILPNTGATNSSGFSALPNGGRRYNAFYGYYNFQWLTNSSTWWSSTVVSSNNPNYIPIWYYGLATSSASSIKQYTFKNEGNAVRCVGN
jgi:uncharacterized protein (TIGR02145 family)